MEEVVELRLTLPQKKLMQSIPSFPDDLGKTVKQAVKKARGTRVQLPYEELEQVAGWLAAEANYEEQARRRQALDRLYERVQNALWDFEDQRLVHAATAPVARRERH